MALVDNEILVGFYQEATGYLPDIRSGLKTLKSAPSDREAAGTVHRLVHSIKGASSMVGISTLSHLAYMAEEAIEETTEGKLPATRKTWTVIEGIIESIGTYLESAAAGKSRERPVVKDVVTRIRRLRGLPAKDDGAAIEELLQLAAETNASGAELPPTGGDFERESVSPELLDAFRAEAEEHLQSISATLRLLKKQPKNSETLLDLRRSVHTFKGAAGVVGLKTISELAHRMEDLLGQLHEGGAKLSGEILNLLFATLDALEDLAADNQSAQIGKRLRDLYGEYSRRLVGVSPGLPRLAHAVDTTEFDDGAGADTAVAPEILEAFALEAEDHLQAIGRLLRDLVKRPKDKDLTLEVRRRVHTLKGAAAMVGITAASGLAHRMEDLLDEVHGDNIELTDVSRDLLFTSTDALEDITSKGGADSELQGQLADILGAYDEFLGAPETAPDLGPDSVLAQLLEDDQVIDLP